MREKAVERWSFRDFPLEFHFTRLSQKLLLYFPNSSKIVSCLFANTGVIIIKKINKNPVQAVTGACGGDQSSLTIVLSFRG